MNKRPSRLATQRGDKLSLFHGNSIHCMRDGSFPFVDLIITSPPFRREDLRMSEEIFLDWTLEAISLMSSHSRVLVMFHSSKMLVPIVKGTTPSKIMIWNKQVGMGAFRYEPIFIYAEKGETLNGAGHIWSDVLSFNPIVGKHAIVPYQNPLELYIQLLRYFPLYERVCDPFMGSGTLARACITPRQRNPKRKFIGYEKNKFIFDKAFKTIRSYIKTLTEE